MRKISKTTRTSTLNQPFHSNPNFFGDTPMIFDPTRTEEVNGDMPITTAQVNIITNAIVTGIDPTTGNCDKTPAITVTEIIGLINMNEHKIIVQEANINMLDGDMFK